MAPARTIPHERDARAYIVLIIMQLNDRTRIANRLYCPYARCSFKVIDSMPTTGERFERAVSIMARLRGPGGCPWDREQTFDSIKPYTLEETYEVLEAIDNRDWDELPGELGDLLLQVLFYSQMAKDQGTFSIDDVLDRLCDQAGRPASACFWGREGGNLVGGAAQLESLKALEKRRKKRQAKSGEAGKNAARRSRCWQEFPLRCRL